MASPLLQRLAIPAGNTLVAFLAYSSQLLFLYIQPGPLRKGDVYLFNAVVACTFICYYRTCFTNPGRIPKDWLERVGSSGDVGNDAAGSQRQRWCRKCEAYKPPRAHHCKTCKQCIEKMDHHCVWTANCVSHITFPHFLRFLIYSVASLVYLECLLYSRCSVLWQKRHLPSYMGPNIYQLAHLLILVSTNSLMLFAMTLLLANNLWTLIFNTTTIEHWEIERHHTLLRRARVLGGQLDGPDGRKMRIEPQEFPWDIGIWANICQGMGGWNPLIWLWPFARSPTVESGLSFEHNGIDDPSKPWPPPDPDRMFRAPRVHVDDDGFMLPMDVDAFKQRQATDMERYTDVDGEYVVRRRPFHERLQATAGSQRVHREKDEQAVLTDGEDELESEEDMDVRTVDRDAGEEAWRNKEGERLADFGVDEVADFYDEDDVPLSELMRRRRGQAS